MNRLKQLRKDKNLTQTQLAEEIGVSKRTIVAWENNQRVIKLNKAQQLANFFDVSTEYLLGFETVDKVEKTVKQWKKDEEALLGLGYILSDDDLYTISRILDGFDIHNREYLELLVEHNDPNIDDYIKLNYYKIHENNPNFIKNILEQRKNDPRRWHSPTREKE